MKTNFQTFKVAVYCFLMGICPLSAQVNDPYMGRWKNENQTAIIEIYTIDNQYHGHAITADDAKRDLLIQMKREKNVLFGGTFFNAKKRTEHEARIRLINDTVFVMKVFSGIFRKRSKWHKVSR